MSRIFEPIMTAPRWQQMLLALVALAALGVTPYFFAIAPAERRVATLQIQHDTIQGELTRLRAMVADLPRVRRQAVEVQRLLDIAQAKLPTEREMPTLYRVLSDAAAQSGLAVALFQPQPARIRDFYSEIPILLVAEGGYHDVGDFVSRVAGLPRTTVIGEFKLSGLAGDITRQAPPPPRPATPPRPAGANGAPAAATSDAGKKLPRPLRTEMTLMTFVYRPVGSAPAPKPGASAAKPEAPKP